MIDFPSTPTVGQIFNSGVGPIYIWDGTAWSIIGPINPAGWETIEVSSPTGVTEWIRTNLSAYSELRLKFDGQNDAVAGAFGVQASVNNGSSWISGASDYSYQYVSGTGASPSANIIATTLWQTSAGQSVIVGVSNGGHGFQMEISKFNKAEIPRMNTVFGYNITGTGAAVTGTMRGIISNSVARNALRLFSNNAFSGRIILEGIRG